jgi:hypothetical protein
MLRKLTSEFQALGAKRNVGGFTGREIPFFGQHPLHDCLRDYLSL